MSSDLLTMMSWLLLGMVLVASVFLLMLDLAPVVADEKVRLSWSLAE